jgi:hypothetical protein
MACCEYRFNICTWIKLRWETWSPYRLAVPLMHAMLNFIYIPYIYDAHIQRETNINMPGISSTVLCTLLHLFFCKKLNSTMHILYKEPTGTNCSLILSRWDFPCGLLLLYFPITAGLCKKEEEIGFTLHFLQKKEI